VYDLALGAKTVISAQASKPAINAFKLIADNRVTAIPIVDAEGEIIGVISARDLKTVAVQKELVKRLYMSAQEFLKTKEREFAGPRTVICCKVTDTFEGILNKLHQSRIHRVFIVNDFYHPIGVVAFTDVLRLLLNWDVAQAAKMLHIKEQQLRHHVVL
jgi:5'-AMP-activated protein kinase regulatory gamma subunit